MPKGSYPVSDTYVGPSKDGSFRSCLCAMLIVFAICGSILLISYFVKSSASKKHEPSYADDSLGTADQQKGNIYNPKYTENEALKPITTTTKKPVKLQTTKKPETPEQNIETKTDISPITDKTEGKPRTEVPITTTVTVKNVLPTEKESTKNVKNTSNNEITTDETTTLSVDESRISQTTNKTEQSNITTTDQPKNVIPEHRTDKSKIHVVVSKDTATEQSTDVTTQQPVITTKPEIPDKSKIHVVVPKESTTEQSTDVTTQQPVITTTKPEIPDKSKINVVNNDTKEENSDVTTTEQPVVDNSIIPGNKITVPPKIEPVTEIITTETIILNPRNKNDDNKIEQNNTVTTQQPNNPVILTTSTTEATITNPPIKDDENKIIVQNNTVTTQQPNIPVNLTVSTTEETSNPPIKDDKNKIKVQTNTVTTQQPNIPVILTTTEVAITNQPTKDDENNLTTQEPINPITILTTEPTTMKPTPRPVVHETEEVDNRRTTLLPEESKHCDAVCVKSAARILTRMRMEGDACEDFYDYACGGDYSDNTPEDHWKKIAAGVEKINEHSPNAYKIFRNFYETCVESQFNYNIPGRFQEATNMIQRVNQSVEAKDNDKAALTVLLTQLLLIDSSPLFDISVDVDKASQRFVFQLNIGKRFLAMFNNKMAKKRCLYQSKKHSEFSIRRFNYLNSTELYEYYWNCLKNTIYTDEEIDDTLHNFFQFYDDSWITSIQNINELFKAYTPAYIRKEISLKNFSYSKISELNYNYRLVNWTVLLSNLVGKEVSEESLVQVYFPDYFKKLFSLLKQIDLAKEVQVQDVILGMYATDLYTNFVLPVPEDNPEEFCLKQSVDLMPEIASSFYLDSFDEEEIIDDQKRVIDLFNAMKNKLIQQIPLTNWTDTSTKTALIKKTKTMRLETWNGSLIWKNDTILDERMKFINLNYSSYNDFKSALNTRKQNMTFNMWNTFAHKQENIWWYFLTPYDTKPAIIYASNLVVIPPGMLFSNSKHLPLYWSLAKLGYKLGKAIGHHFDHIGSKYNISLEGTTSISYLQAEKCTEFYYKQEKTEMIYDGRNINYKVSDDIIGVSTIERYVVQISLNLISSMLNITKDDFNITMFANSEFAEVFYPEKLFFIVLGQEHCRKPNLDEFILSLYESEHLPSALLLNTALIHSERFSKAFSCRDGSRINQILKCAAFPNIDVADTDTYDYL